MKVEMSLGTVIDRAATTRLRVTRRDELTPRVVALDLAPAPGGSALEGWTAGAHVSLHLPSGLVRQFSLCGNPDELDAYRIAVLLEDDGRGGSREVHHLKVGDDVEVSRPRNSFPLADADRHLLVAGGIGITPISAMAWQLHNDRRPFTVVLALRSPGDVALGSLLPPGCDLRTHTRDNPLKIDGLLSTLAAGTAVEVCGPPRMLADASSWSFALQRTGSSVHVEHFEASAQGLSGIHVVGDQPFSVTFARTKERVVVSAGDSILAQARALGKIVDSSCEEGYCGTCETGVLAGTPDHRDDFLSPEEKAAGETMMICVSRCASGDLTLDL